MNFTRGQVRVLFLVHVPTHDPVAECLAVTGSHEAMGSWNSDNAVIAEYIGAATWQVALYLPRDESIQWKWLMLSREAKGVLKEEKVRRDLVTFDGDLSVECFWNGQEMITAFHSAGRRYMYTTQFEKTSLDQKTHWENCEGEGDLKKTKSKEDTWDSDQSLYAFQGSESDKGETRKSRSVSHLRVRFADEIPDDDYVIKQRRSLSNCLQISKRSLAKCLYPGKRSSFERTKASVINWKKIADYGIPFGVVTGAAALGVFIFRKWL